MSELTLYTTYLPTVVIIYCTWSAFPWYLTLIGLLTGILSDGAELDIFFFVVWHPNFEEMKLHCVNPMTLTVTCRCCHFSFFCCASVHKHSPPQSEFRPTSARPDYRGWFPFQPNIPPVHQPSSTASWTERSRVSTELRVDSGLTLGPCLMNKWGTRFEW